MNKEEPHFLIIAGEASGDLHGAKLVQALLDIYPKARFTGMGGIRMQETGVNTLFGIERMGTVGLVEIFAKIICINLKSSSLSTVKRKCDKSLAFSMFKHRY